MGSTSSESGHGGRLSPLKPHQSMIHLSEFLIDYRGNERPVATGQSSADERVANALSGKVFPEFRENWTNRRVIRLRALPSPIKLGIRIYDDKTNQSLRDACRRAGSVERTRLSGWCREGCRTDLWRFRPWRVVVQAAGRAGWRSQGDSRRCFGSVGLFECLGEPGCWIDFAGCERGHGRTPPMAGRDGGRLDRRRNDGGRLRHDQGPRG
jgi:hypothetical protein